MRFSEVCQAFVLMLWEGGNGICALNNMFLHRDTIPISFHMLLTVKVLEIRLETITLQIITYSYYTPYLNFR